jgi:probable HAF family extracellular repeat protein
MRTRPFPIACVLALSGAASAQNGPLPPVFRGVGDLPGGGYGSRALGVGRFEKPELIVGESLTADGWRAFTLTLRSPIEELPSLAPGDDFSTAVSIARTRVGFFEPPVVVGASGAAPSVGQAAAVRWSGTPLMPQGVGPATGAFATSLARAISDNGRVIVGDGLATPGGARAFRWSQATGLQGLGSLPASSPDGSTARGVSASGSVIVGSARNAALENVAIRWTDATGMVALGHLNTSGPRDSRALACSSDGAVIVGESTSPNGPLEAFRWASGGLVGLGDLPGGAFRSSALAVTAKGDKIVGWSEAADGERAFIWDAANGMRDLKALLTSQGFNTTGWDLTRANAISPRGTLIVGEGVNPIGHAEGWLFHNECYGDCNGDGRHTVNDYGCFQTRFSLGDMWCDCNGSGTLTVADFPCWKDGPLASGDCP